MKPNGADHDPVEMEMLAELLVIRADIEAIAKDVRDLKPRFQRMDEQLREVTT